MQISSPAFAATGRIPSAFTCDGQNTPPPLDISDVPPAVAGLVLIVDDPDSPFGTWQHWLVWNLPPDTSHLALPLPDSAVTGQNDFGQAAYIGPCPHGGLHHYHFRLFALDSSLNLPPGSSRAQLDRAMTGHIIGQADLVGVYSRP